ncbi:MAG: hypothetical protein AABW54_02680 [Candidatus Micrarchaeota archaeon]
MQVVSSKPVGLADVVELLSKRKAEASGTLEYEQANTLAYAEAFSQLDGAKVNALRKDVSGVTALPEELLFQIVDLLPRKEEELALILAAGKVELPKEQLKEIVKVVKKYKKA